MSRKTRKLMWSVPLIAAVAVIGALAAFGTLGFGNVFANELPDNPQNLKVKAADGDLGQDHPGAELGGTCERRPRHVSD